MKHLFTVLFTEGKQQEGPVARHKRHRTCLQHIKHNLVFLFSGNDEQNASKKWKLERLVGLSTNYVQTEISE